MADDYSFGLEVLRSEISWLEELLDENEDWRALGQLEAREARGEDLRSIHGATLKAALVASLAHNRVFVRRQVLITELLRAEQDRVGSPSSAVASEAIELENLDVADVRRIKGITPALQRRLGALSIATIDQIAQWQTDDVLYVSRTLGLGDRIDAEGWIEQAQTLVRQRSVRDVSSPVSIATVAEQKVATPIEAIASPPEPEPHAIADLPLPLPAWRYGRTTRPPLSISEAMKILGLSSSFVDVRPVADPATVVSSVVESRQSQADATAERTAVEDVMTDVVEHSAASVEPEDQAPIALAPAKPVGPPPKPWPAQRYWSAALVGVVQHELEPVWPLPASAYAPLRACAAHDPVPEVAVPEVSAPHAVNSHPAVVVTAAAGSQNKTIVGSLAPATPTMQTPPVERTVEQVLPLPPNPFKTAVAEVPLIQTPPPISQALLSTTPGSADTLLWAIDMVRETTAIESKLTQTLAERLPELPAVPFGQEAQVTIRHAHDALGNTARPGPGVTSADLPRQQNFDAKNYAAYRGQAEEASVEIVRTPLARVPAPLPRQKSIYGGRATETSHSPLGRLFKSLTDR